MPGELKLTGEPGQPWLESGKQASALLEAWLRPSPHMSLVIWGQWFRALGQTLTWVISLHPVYVTAAVSPLSLLRHRQSVFAQGHPARGGARTQAQAFRLPHLALLRWGAGRLSGTAALTIKHILFMIVMKGRRVALCLRTGSLQLGGDLKTS